MIQHTSLPNFHQHDNDFMEALQRFEERRERALEAHDRQFFQFVDEMTAELEERDKQQSQLQAENEALKIALEGGDRRYKKLSDAHDKILVKYRKEKAAILGWQSYIEGHRKRQERRHGKPDPFNDQPAMPSCQPVRPAQETRGLLQDLGYVSFAGSNAAHLPTPHSPALPPATNRDVEVTSSAKIVASSAPKPPNSSQATEDDEAVIETGEACSLENHANVDNDDDEPEVVAVREVKHRGRKSAIQPATTSTANDGSTSASLHVKREPSSVSQYNFTAHFQQVGGESMDLDEPGPWVGTPHKRQELETQSRNHQQAGLSKSQSRPSSSHRSNDRSEPCSQQSGATSVSRPLLDRTPNLMVRSGREDDSNAKKRKRISDPLIEKVSHLLANEIADDGVGVQENDQNVADLYDFAPVPSVMPASSGNLSNYSHNRHARLKDLLNDPIPSRSSLGGDNPGKLRPRTKSKAHRTSAPANLRPGGSTRSPAADLIVDLVDGSPTLKIQHQRRQFDFETELPAKKSRDARLGKKQRLRDLPASDLRPDDFKINSRINQGVSHAFSETVRVHEQRRCLPGCTKPGCCGDKFKRFVELSGGMPRNSTGMPRWNDQNDDADTRLLKSFLGASDVTLQGMDSRVKQEALVSAKSWELASKHGKHRAAFERPSTPPGFWDTGMPTTQDMEEDRLKAGEIEKRKVTERHREAMKSGGRWMFRDE
ncbi:MAG: hypothetical protein M1814_005121 [Vezdaea aestivalis]|nr:MAG: hypothetical protein M1814_005121 [Vezdaea aestivalis]